MQISMIAAMAKGRVIGKGNQMPWHLPADLKHFKQVTLKKPVLMGRKTYESIGKALPGRKNIVISTQADFCLDDAKVFTSPELALESVCQEPEVMIIGGGRIYRHFLPVCHRLYLTEIDLEVEGDTMFPDYQSDYHWQQVEESWHEVDEKNPHQCHFITLDKMG